MSRPTIAQVKECWDATENPSARIVAKKMTDAGFDVSFRTVARHAETGFKEKPKKKRTIVDTAAQAEAKALEKKQALVEKALTGAINGRVGDLMTRTSHDLQEEQRKALMALNIALCEEAAKVMPILVLNPKETGDLLKASADVAKIMQDTRAGNGDAPPGNGVIIEATATEVKIDPLAEALNDFRKADAEAA